MSTQVAHTVTSVDSQRAVWIAGAGCIRHELVGEELYHQHMQRIAASVHGRGTASWAWWSGSPRP